MHARPVQPGPCGTYASPRHVCASTCGDGGQTSIDNDSASRSCAATVCAVTRPVFSEPSVARDGWLGWSEPNINFYRESTMPEAVIARAWINAAYERFSDPTGEFAGRLRSADFVQHASAMAELYVHSRLLKPDHRIVYEEDGTGPDFRVYQSEDYIGAVEVCSLFDNQTWEAEQQRHARIADELNRRIPLDLWFVHFDVVRLDRPPSIKQLVAWVRARVDELPRSELDVTSPTPWVTY